MIDRRSFLGGAAASSSLALAHAKSLSGAQQTCSRPALTCEGSTIQLANGRQLSYATYGAEGGWPILYFHGIPTSRIEARFFADAASRAGCQLIAIDRPGFGVSDFQINRSVCDWLSDVQEFVRSPHLPHGIKLDRFSIACFSSGAAYSLLCAAKLPLGQVKSIGIVDGIAPLELISGCGGMAQMVFRLAYRRPRVAEAALQANARQMRRRPHLVLRRISRFFSKCDNRVFFEPANARILIDSYLQCVHCGPQGVAYDMALLSQPWGFALNEVTCPVGLWYGACDITTPVNSMGMCLHRSIPNSTMTVFPGQGHLSMLNVAGDQLFQFLLANG